MSTAAFRSARKSSGNFKISKGAVVCSEAQLVGDITIGAQTVVQPSARILAEGGPIVIGDGNLIQEQVTIINRKREGETESKTLTIGKGNVFEVGACNVGPNTEITDHCVVGAGCEVNFDEELPPNTVIFGADYQRYTRKAASQASNQQQLEYLIKVLPNYHHLIKTTPPPAQS